ncbi:MAG: HNH endonuclease [Roseovarius sp.]|nr:HNH endonuclease [Roseovarius sp.]MBD11609.1 HNH endonuclease [Roseovarius sp.]
MVTPEILREILRYEPKTGLLFWRERPQRFFRNYRSCRSWNGKFAGTEALNSANDRGYKCGNIFAKHYASHRVVWAIVHGEWPTEQVDHINGDRADNRIENLRAVSSCENNQNRQIPSNNSSGQMGVSWHKSQRKWCASITVAGQRSHLGHFNCITAAKCARIAAEAKHRFHSNHGRARA